MMAIRETDRIGESALPAKADERGLTAEETRDLFQPMAEMMPHTNWRDLPKIWAIGIAAHRMLEKKAPEIAAAAQAALDEIYKKIG